MSNQRYTPEFTEEAVRQVVDRGHSVAEVADRLGVSSHQVAQMRILRGDLQLEAGLATVGMKLWAK